MNMHERAAPHGNEPVTSLSEIITNVSQCAEMSLPFHTAKTKARKQVLSISTMSELGVFANIVNSFMTHFTAEAPRMGVVYNGT